MKRTQFFFYLVIVLLMTHCRSARNTSDSPKMRNEVAGTYVGTLPCADCEGIRYQLRLAADGTYQEDMFYVGKSQQSTKSSGNWTLNGSNVVLGGKDAMNRFSIETGQLRMLDRAGQVITGNQAPRYVLQKRGETGRPEGYDNINGLIASKTAEGIDFYATGNEPSWSLDIDAGKMMSFRAMGGVSITTAVPKTENIDGGKRLSATAGSGSLEVRIYEKACTDNMSGVMMNRRVEVTTGGKTYTGCGQTLTTALDANR